VSRERDEPGHCLRAPLSELTSASDVQEKLYRTRARFRIEDARKRVDDVVRSDLAPVVELHAFPEFERPCEPVARGPPELRQRRFDDQSLIELDEAIEDLLGDGPAVDVADTGWVEGLGVLPQWAPIYLARGCSVSVLRPHRQRSGTDERPEQ